MIDPLEYLANKYSASSPEEAMIFLCRSVRQKAHELAPPIGLRSILSALGVKHQYENGSGILARVSVKDSEIVVKTRHFERSMWRRHRFSIAHEIGHVILMKSLSSDKEAYSSLNSSKNWKRVESLCNLAASEILMPTEFFTEDIRDDIKEGKILELYDKYLVSYEAILQRILTMNFDILLFWKQRNETQDWYVKKAYWKDDFFVPNRITSRKHLFPDVFSFFATLEDFVEMQNVDLKFSGTIYNSDILAGLYPKRKKISSRQPMFESFQVEDEISSEYDAFSFFKVKRSNRPRKVGRIPKFRLQ
jgi:hypothetical protein